MADDQQNGQQPVTLDMSKAKPISAVTLDMSKAQPLNAGTDFTTPPAPTPTQLVGQFAGQAGEGVENIAKGAAKGLGGTLWGGADLANRGLRGLLSPTGAQATNELRDRLLPPMPPKPDFLKPSNLAQDTGFLGEQTGEFLLPGPTAEEGAARLATKFPALGSPRGLLAARTVGEGALTGALNKAQGGSFATGATLGAVGPALEGATSEMQIKVGNKLIRPRDVQFSYGKNPGRAVKEVGVTKDFPSLVSKLQELKQSSGAEIDRVLSQPQFANARTDVTPLVEGPIDKRIAQVGKSRAITTSDKQAVTQALNELKAELTTAYAPGQVGPRTPLNMNLNPMEQTALKREVGDSTRWTGNISDDYLNGARREIYSNLRGSVEKAVPDVKEANRMYGDALEAQTAAGRRMHAMQRNETLSLSDMLAGSIAGGLTGGPKKVLVGVGGAVASHAAKSPLGRTLEMKAIGALPYTRAPLLGGASLLRNQAASDEDR
jgi:hypothetical protein